jgi:hypothetical protein
VLLAVIGPRWLADIGPDGCRSIDDANDWIRRELVEAFTAGVTVIPVLIDEAELPTADQLPADISALARRQYRRLRHREASTDIARIVDDVVAADPDLAATERWSGGAVSQVATTVRLTGRVAAGLVALVLVVALAVIVAAVIARPSQDVAGRPGNGQGRPPPPPPGEPPPWAGACPPPGDQGTDPSRSGSAGSAVWAPTGQFARPALVLVAHRRAGAGARPR